jgi:hypothetical protein
MSTIDGCCGGICTMMTIDNSDRGRHPFTKLAVSVFAALSLCVSTASAQTYIFGRADFSVASNPVAVATGDFNGDGKLDLVVTADNTVSVLLGQVDGTFSSHVDYPTGTYPALLSPRWWAIATFGFVLLPGASRRGRSALRLLPLALLLLIGSCGGSNTSMGPQPNPNDPPVGTYTLTVGAMSGSETQSIPLTLKVE